jgi:transposase-like protein
MRNLPKKAYPVVLPMVLPMVKSALDENEETLGEVAQDVERLGYSKAAATIEQFMFDVGNYRAFPKSHWRRIRTRNMVERVNVEIKRRSRVVGAFPSPDSVIRLICSILMDVNEDWITGKRYLNMSEFEDQRLESGVSTCPVKMCVE